MPHIQLLAAESANDGDSGIIPVRVITPNLYGDVGLTQNIIAAQYTIVELTKGFA
jgi:hypothetical protein